MLGLQEESLEVSVSVPKVTAITRWRDRALVGSTCGGIVCVYKTRRRRFFPHTPLACYSYFSFCTGLILPLKHGSKAEKGGIFLTHFLHQKT